MDPVCQWCGALTPEWTLYRTPINDSDLGEISRGAEICERCLRLIPHDTRFIHDNWTTENEVARLRAGLLQIVEGDYPADAGNTETWAEELLHDSNAVYWRSE